MRLFIEKYAECVSVRKDEKDITDKRILIIWPGESLILKNVNLTYDELINGPRVINPDVWENRDQDIEI